MTDCLFCSLSTQEKSPSFFWQNQHFFGLLDVFPVNPGHYLIIPKRHVVEFDDLNQEEWLSLKEAVKLSREEIATYDLAEAYQEIINNKVAPQSVEYCQEALNFIKNNGFKPEAFNIGVNDGEAAGRTIHHLHIHIIPRFSGDMKDPTGGVRGVMGLRQKYG